MRIRSSFCQIPAEESYFLSFVFAKLPEVYESA